MSAVFADFDKNGTMDLMTASWQPDDNLAYYENTGSSFTLVNKASRYVPTETEDLSGLISGDFDNNNAVDVEFPIVLFTN